MARIFVVKNFYLKSKTLWLTFFIGLFASSFYIYTLQIQGDQFQLIRRGLLLAHFDKWVHYGAWSSAGMGNILGSLTTFLAGMPWLLWDHPYSPVILVLILHCFAYALMLKGLKKHGLNFLICYSIFFWVNPWRSSEAILWNPGYLFFPMALHFYTSMIMVEKKSFIATFSHAMAVGFASQIHNSVLILALISLFLFLKKRIKVHWIGFISAAIIIFLSLIPYYLEMIKNPAISPMITEDDKFIGKGLLTLIPILKGLTYWFRYTSAYFARYIFKELNFLWISSNGIQTTLATIWMIIKWPMAISTIGLSGYVIIQYVKKYLAFIRLRVINEENKIHEYCMLTYFAVFVSSALSPISLLHWHLIITLPIACIPISHFFAQRIQDRKWSLIGISYLLLFVIYNFFAASGSHKHKIDRPMYMNYKSLELKGALDYESLR